MHLGYHQFADAPALLWLSTLAIKVHDTRSYNWHDHSCSWLHDAVQWNGLRRAADDHLASRTPWSEVQLARRLPHEALRRCPLGAHTQHLLDLDAAAGVEEAGPLEAEAAQAALFGVHTHVSLIDFVLSGWPAFGLLHHACQRHVSSVGGDRCASWEQASSFLSNNRQLSAGGVVFADVVKPILASQSSVLRLRQSNASASGVAEDRDFVISTLEQIAQFLRSAQDRWLSVWQPRFAAGAPFLTHWFGLSEEEPCCQMWSELARAQQWLRSLHELPCLSGHRKVDGLVCPACQLLAQASWAEERRDAELALRRLHLHVVSFDVSQRFADAPRHVPHEAQPFSLATVLTCEDAEVSTADKSRGPRSDDDANNAQFEARAVLLTYIDAIRTLAFSGHRLGLGPLLVLLSLAAGSSLPSGIGEVLAALQSSGLILVRYLPSAPLHLRPSLWAKLQLWRLHEYKLVLYLDADTVLVGDITDLLISAASAQSVVFAAAFTRSMTSMNTGVMLLRPDDRMYERLLQSYSRRLSWTGVSRWSGQRWNQTARIPIWVSQSGEPDDIQKPIDGHDLAVAFAGSSNDDRLDVSGAWRTDLADQDWRNEFVALSLTYGGELELRGGHGSCDPSKPWLEGYLEALLLEPTEQWQREELEAASGSDVYCTLPASYNFCATAPCLARLAGAAASAAEVAVEVGDAGDARALPHPSEAAFAGAAFAASAVGSTGRAAISQLLESAKVLHWPGSLRKPWQRCLPAARSSLDEVWWRTFAAACAESPFKAPCRIRC
mmetsp:Transcript_18357/g.48312  ORF Transcript_18357/g.48312 Transcript_18357/m.48312 type:complete len:779 (-) Transcript_18357:128-2464(-)